jgi:hypothetical protein
MKKWRKMMNDKLDCLGHVIHIGDMVLLTGTRKGLYIREVIDIKDVMIYTSRGREYPRDVMVLNSNQVAAYKDRARRP